MSIYILKPMANLQENAAFFFFCGETKQKKRPLCVQRPKPLTFVS